MASIQQNIPSPHQIYGVAPDGTMQAVGTDGSGNLNTTSGSGGGTVNQGTPNTVANAWPVKVTDGTNVLGTSGNPLRVDPTGTTTQPVSISGNQAVQDTADGNPGSAAPAVATYIGGVDSGGLLRGITTDTAGSLNVNASTVPINLPSFVQEAQSDQPSGSQTSWTIAFTNNNTAGSLLIFVTRTNGNLTSITDSQGNSWVTTQSGHFWYALNCKAGANTVTATYSSASSFQSAIAEYSNVANQAPDFNIFTNGTSSTPNSGSATTSANYELIIGWVYNTTTNAPNYTAGSGFTLRSTGGVNVGLEDKVLKTAGSTSASFTSGAGSIAWNCGAVAFRALVSEVVNQGTANSISNAWPVEVTNGTNIQQVGSDGNAKVNTESAKSTYSSAFSITLAATPTDVAIINGSASKTIRVTRVQASGTAATPGDVDVSLIVRSAANTGGTSTAQTAVKHDSNDGTATAAILAYTANPTTGTAVGAVRIQKFPFVAVGSPGFLEWSFTTRNTKGIVLRGAAQGLAVNLNGNTLPVGASTLDVDMEWTEE